MLLCVCFHPSATLTVSLAARFVSIQGIPLLPSAGGERVACKDIQHTVLLLDCTCSMNCLEIVLVVGVCRGGTD